MTSSFTFALVDFPRHISCRRVLDVLAKDMEYGYGYEGYGADVSIGIKSYHKFKYFNCMVSRGDMFDRGEMLNMWLHTSVSTWTSDLCRAQNRERVSFGQEEDPWKPFQPATVDFKSSDSHSLTYYYAKTEEDEDESDPQYNVSDHPERREDKLTLHCLSSSEYPVVDNVCSITVYIDVLDELDEKLTIVKNLCSKLECKTEGWYWDHVSRNRVDFRRYFNDFSL